MSSDNLSDDDALDIALYIGQYEGDRNENGERHGLGKAMLPNGDQYDGEYQKGKRHGYGRYKFTKGSARYEGGYENGRRSGQGTFWYPDGSVYTGSWVDGQREGYGTYEYINGDVYVGEWKEGRRHGQGVYTYKQEGIKYKGNWSNGKFDEEGEVITPNFTYSGTFSGEEPLGPGKYHFDLGCEQEGEYVTQRTVVHTAVSREVVHVPVWRCHALHDAPPKKPTVSPGSDE